MVSFGVEQPGYYIPESDLDDHKSLSPDYFIRKVLVPETAISLIAEDLNMVLTDPLVDMNLEDSRAYGVENFPDTASLI
ncbi:hypothetical protein VP01_7802g1 [Puccinia sorghi]|uniref:Restriction of telomere capping protein 4 C-terminal domain-containing protein n=1 Tax=Puccinia sorghi TaxID=27349 RepID=A0A0L6UD99_9BASI|nr:hypothetical protein VP01_7802g1 [Puccinia sorghi]